LTTREIRGCNREAENQGGGPGQYDCSLHVSPFGWCLMLCPDNETICSLLKPESNL